LQASIYDIRTVDIAIKDASLYHIVPFKSLQQAPSGNTSVFKICLTTTMSKLLTVFGATGNQGGSVIKAVLEHPQLSKTYRIRAITRDIFKPAAATLREQGAEVIAVRAYQKPNPMSADSGLGRFER
jgi:hypothetical protein